MLSSLWHLLLFYVLVGLLAGICHSSKFILLDSAGQETAHLYDGGEVKCETGDIDVEDQNNATSHIALGGAMVGVKVKCETDTMTITYLLCNPLIRRPITALCRPGDHCVVNAKKEQCEHLGSSPDGKCWLGQGQSQSALASLSSMSTVCTASDAISKEKQSSGLCNYINIASEGFDKQVRAVSTAAGQPCSAILWAGLNEARLVHRDLALLNEDKNILTLKSPEGYKMACQLLSSEKNSKPLNGSSNSADGVTVTQYLITNTEVQRQNERYALSCTASDGNNTAQAQLVAFLARKPDVSKIDIEVEPEPPYNQKNNVRVVCKPSSVPAGYFALVQWNNDIFEQELSKVPKFNPVIYTAFAVEEENKCSVGFYAATEPPYQKLIFVGQSNPKVVKLPNPLPREKKESLKRRKQTMKIIKTMLEKHRLYAFEEQGPRTAYIVIAIITIVGLVTIIVVGIWLCCRVRRMKSGKIGVARCAVCNSQDTTLAPGSGTTSAQGITSAQTFGATEKGGSTTKRMQTYGYVSSKKSSHGSLGFWKKPKKTKKEKKDDKTQSKGSSLGLGNYGTLKTKTSKKKKKVKKADKKDKSNTNMSTFKSKNVKGKKKK